MYNSVVYSSSASRLVISFANRLAKKLGCEAKTSLCGENAVILGDFDAPETKNAKERLLSLEGKSYLIKAYGKNIVISALCENALVMAVKRFEKEALKEDAFISDDYEYSGSESYKYIFENGVTISQEENHLISEKFGGQYPSLIRLEHNGENNGTLLATFEGGGSVYRIFKSTDDGKSWDYVTDVRDEYNKGWHNDWMPCLFELPADIGKFKKGTIILGGTSKDEPIREFDKSTVTVYASCDLGTTWETLGNVASGGGVCGPSGNDLGVWEPYFIYDEETGRLYCFYSDDSDPRHDQKLVYKYTYDLESWSELYEAVACDDERLRPGMIAIAKMNNGKYVMTYEMVRLPGAPVYFKTADALDDWGDIADYGRMLKSLDGKTVGSTPWVAYSPIIGEKGMLIMAGRFPLYEKEGRIVNDKDSDIGAEIFVSFDCGEHFVTIEPFIHYRTEKCGWSPCFFFAPDGNTMYYAVNSMRDGNRKIFMTKLHIEE